MSEELKNILPDGKDQPDDRKLLDYLNEQLSKADAHELEKQMSEDPFINDAIEGLQDFDRKKDMQAYVTALNKKLRKQLTHQKVQRNKRRWKDQPWIYLAVGMTLLLLILCYIVIKKIS